MGSMTKFLTLTSIFSLVGVSQFPGSTWANETVQLSLAAGNESNVTRGFHDPHILSSDYVSAQLQAAKLFQPGLNDSLLLGSSFSVRRYGQASGFDQITAAVSAAHTHKFGFGPYAHQLNTSASYSWSQSRGRARDHETATLSLGWSKRLSPAWAVSAALSAQENNADTLASDPSVTALGYDPDIALPYELYDFDSQSLAIRADYTFANGVMLLGSYTRINGHSIASTNHPDLKVYKIAEAFYTDPAFVEGWYAYQLESNTDAYRLSISIPLDQDMALDISGGWFDIAAPGSKHYENSEMAVGITWGF